MIFVARASPLQHFEMRKQWRANCGGSSLLTAFPKVSLGARTKRGGRWRIIHQNLSDSRREPTRLGKGLLPGGAAHFDCNSPIGVLGGVVMSYP